jgi:hypothetical protein
MLVLFFILADPAALDVFGRIGGCLAIAARVSKGWLRFEQESQVAIVRRLMANRRPGDRPRPDSYVDGACEVGTTM